MTRDHTPESAPGDDDVYPRYCGACDRHVIAWWEHADDCPNRTPHREGWWSM